METTWAIVATDGQFAVVDYTRGGKTIRLQVLPPTPRERETPEEALAKRIVAHEPTPEQFDAAPAGDPSHLVGASGTTSKPSQPIGS
jgi:hypothetical protein